MTEDSTAARLVADAPMKGRQANFLLLPQVKHLRPRDIAPLNADDAYDAFKMLRWGWTDGRPTCSCGAERVYEFSSRNIFRCPICGKQFSASSGTLFHSRKLSHKSILSALAISIHDPVNAHRLSLELGVEYKTSSNLIKRFRLFSGNIQPVTRLNGWPYLNRDPKDDAERLMMTVSKAVPQTLPEQVRADVCQELILGLLAADFTESDLAAQLRAHIRRHYKTVEFDKFNMLSFDQPVPGTDGLAWASIISNERASDAWEKIREAN